MNRLVQRQLRAHKFFWKCVWLGTRDFAKIAYRTPKDAIKKLLIKRWAKQISVGGVSYPKQAITTPPDEGCLNLCGLGGHQKVSMYQKTWQSVYDEMTVLEQTRINIKSPQMSAYEALFFAYFAPLEHWLDERCSTPYYLWSDGKGVYLQLTSPEDELMWVLSFGALHGKLPKLEDI